MMRQRAERGDGLIGILIATGRKRPLDGATWLTKAW
jgi:hypothetical protein